jgi:hypothetical protein
VALPVEGAPLVFSTAFAHDLVLHLNGPGPETDIPLTPDAFQGGLVAPTANPATPPPLPDTAPSHPSNTITGTITGYWGFDAFKGPTLFLQNTPGKDWKLDSADVLIAGRENHLTLSSTGTACIDKITLDAATGKTAQTQWKPAPEPQTVEVTVSLKSDDPGALHLAVQQFGSPKADTVAAQTYSEPATLKSLDLHAGDTTADLTGTSLDQVQKLAINDLTYTPAPPSTPANQDTATPAPAPSDPGTNLRLTLPPNVQAPKFRVGDRLSARLTLKDGRTLTLPVTVAPPRPSVVILSKNIGQPTGSPIHLAGKDDLPINQQLVFSLRSAAPFPRTGQLEIAGADDTLHTTLSVAAGNLVLQNPHTLLATLDPLKAFGRSTTITAMHTITNASSVPMFTILPISSIGVTLPTIAASIPPGSFPSTACETWDECRRRTSSAAAHPWPSHTAPRLCPSSITSITLVSPASEPIVMMFAAQFRLCRERPARSAPRC